VAPEANVTGRTLRELALPYEVTVTLVVRGHEVIMPRGRTVLVPGDRVFVAMRRRIKPLMDCLFDTSADPVLLAPGQEIVFRADHTAGQLCGFFSLACPRGPFLVTPGEDDGLVTLIFAPETLTPASFPAGRAPVSGD
jgi:cell volume regulation protein A